MNEPKKKAEQKVKLRLNRETLRMVETQELHLLDRVVGGTEGGSATGDFATQSSCTTFLCREN
jgi:hypothetical protein